MSIAGNIAKIEERIQKACDKAGRKRGEITLMGVSKFVQIEKIEEAFSAGVRCFGESRIKEASEKFENWQRQDSQLHFIGYLQRNKAKQAALLFDCIQSVDRDELIEELDKQSLARLKPLKVLLEMRTGEETKSGYVNIESLFKAAESVLNCKMLKLSGLMTMAPFTDDIELIRSSFRQLVKVQNELEKRYPGEDWTCLSMGMSNDFETAVEEGSTMLRIGSAIFND